MLLGNSSEVGEWFYEISARRGSSADYDYFFLLNYELSAVCMQRLAQRLAIQ